MLMLILETFVLMLISALLGTALGSLLAEAGASGAETDRPWLRDRRALPALPALPVAPAVMPEEERRRLLAGLSAPSPAVATAPLVSRADGAESPAPAAVATSPVAEEIPAITQADAARAAEADAHGSRPTGLLRPRGVGADDLKRIKGIGKQNEARLNALGIWHFDQIAAWTPENIRWAGSFLAFVGRIEREDWVGQAEVLAAGGTTEFAARVDADEVPSSSS